VIDRLDVVAERRITRPEWHAEMGCDFGPQSLPHMFEWWMTRAACQMF
jgi:ribosomal protein S19E (S16A)